MDEIFKKIEENIESYKYTFQIGDEFIQLRDETEDKEVKANAQWEIDAFNFMINEGELKPKFQSAGKNGELISYPSMEHFTDETYDYFIERLKSCKHPRLVAIYATLLWNSPKKHNRYASLTVKAYLELVDFYKTRDKEDIESKNHYGLSVIDSLKNAYTIARQSKDAQLKTVKQAIIETICSYPDTSSSVFALRLNLSELALKENFSKTYLKKCKSIIVKMGNAHLKDKDYSRAIQSFELIEKLCEKIKEAGCRTWIRKQALCFEKLSVAKGKQADMSHLHNCEQAIILYQKLKDSKKIDVLKKRYDKLKSSQVFNTLSVPLDDELGRQVREQNEKLSKEISDKPVPEIIGILTFSKFVLPDVDKTKKIADDIASKHVFTHLANTQIFDTRNNTPEKFFEEDSKEKLNHIQHYLLTFELSYADFLYRILYRSIAKNGLFIVEVLTYLSEKSWYGEVLKRKMGNDTIEYAWLDLISPAFNDYFIEFRRLMLGAQVPNFVLATDSLTLKVEGIVRDICRLKKISTTRFKDDGTTIELDLPGMLHLPELSQVIDADDIFLMKIILTEKSGFNLRHRIAHNLMVRDEYSIVYVNLLFVLILRLGKYQLTKKK